MYLDHVAALLLCTVTGVVATQSSGLCEDVLRTGSCLQGNITEADCLSRGCCYTDQPSKKCLYPKAYFTQPSKATRAYFGTTFLKIPDPVTALSIDEFRKRVERELTQAFRYKSPQVQKVTVEDFTDTDVSYVIKVVRDKNDVIDETTLADSYSGAISREDSTIINVELFGETVLQDYDECLDADICGATTTCVNNPGSYRCECREGYTGIGEGGCKDVNECESGSACRDDQDCINSRGSYSCICKIGKRPNRDNTACMNDEIDECASGEHNCPAESSTCRDTQDGYTCECNSGYLSLNFLGETYCVDNDECASQPCHPSAICKNTVGSYECTCPGSDVRISETAICLDKDSRCRGKTTCHENAVCMETAASYRCECKDGFYGDGIVCKRTPNCRIGQGLRCHESASCLRDESVQINSAEAYKCRCNVGYQGDGVDACTDVNECEEESAPSCGENTICKNTNGSYLCTCLPGFEKTDTGSCVDIDECWLSIDECVIGAVCENLPGSYKCTCASGYGGDGKIACETADIFGRSSFENRPKKTPCDPMSGPLGASITCGANAYCDFNNENSVYECRCDAGFEGKAQKSCYDLDECSEQVHSCNAAASCNNTQGSYSCDCMAGYVGDGRECRDVNECELQQHDCHSDATCFNTRGSFSCECDLGFTGDGRQCDELSLYVGMVQLTPDFLYTASLPNASSAEYLALSEIVSDELFLMYTSGSQQKVYDVGVKSFRKGSVLVEHVVATVGGSAAELLRSISATLRAKGSSIISEAPEMLNKVESLSEVLPLETKSTTGILTPEPPEARITKVFSSVIHLRPTLVTYYEKMFSGKIVELKSEARVEFSAKLQRELTNVHSYGNSYVSSVEIKAIRPARLSLMQMKQKVDAGMKYYKAWVMVSGREAAAMLSGKTFRNAVANTMAKLTRSYGFAIVENMTAVEEHEKVEEMQYDSISDYILVSYLGTRSPTVEEYQLGSGKKNPKLIVEHLIVIRDDVMKLDVNYLQNSFKSSKFSKAFEGAPWGFIDVPPEEGAVEYFKSILQQWDVTSLDVVGNDLLACHYDVVMEGPEDVLNLEEIDLLNTFVKFYEDGIMESKKTAYVGTPKAFALKNSVTSYPIPSKTTSNKLAKGKKTKSSFTTTVTGSIYLSPKVERSPLDNRRQQEDKKDLISKTLAAAYKGGLEMVVRDGNKWEIEDVAVEITTYEKIGVNSMYGGVGMVDFKMTISMSDSSVTVTKELLQIAFDIAAQTGLFDSTIFVGVPWNINVISEVQSTTTTPPLPLPTTFAPFVGTNAYRTTGFSSTSKSQVKTTVTPTPLTTTAPSTGQTPSTSGTPEPSRELKDVASAFALLMQAPMMGGRELQRRVSKLSPYSRSLLRAITGSPDTPLYMGTKAIMHINVALEATELYGRSI